MVSPSSRQAEMSKKSTSSLRDLTLLTASPKEQTGMPSLVKRSSGSLVRLPASTTRLKFTTSLSSFSVPYKGNNTGTFSVLKRYRFSQAWVELRSSTFRCGHLQLLVLYGGDHIPVLVVAEDLRAYPLQPVEGLWRGMPVGVVRTALDDGHFGRKAAEKQWGRRGVGAVVGHLQNRQWTSIRAVRHILFLVRLGVAGEQDSGRAVGQQDGHGVVVDLGEQTTFRVRWWSYNVGPHPSP